MNKLQEVYHYIEELEYQSFEGWQEEEIRGYLTAVCSIKNKIQELDTKEK